LIDILIINTVGTWPELSGVDQNWPGSGRRGSSGASINSAWCPESIDVSHLGVASQQPRRSLNLGFTQGIDYLHEQKPPIIHRNVNPENIKLKIGSNNRFVKIGDFGIAVVHLYDEQSLSKDRGHPDFIASEVKKGTSYNTKADIYSLGRILEELFYIDVNKYELLMF